MAEAEAETEDARCRALTAEGARCSRTAGADGFCYQHDESDPTVDDAEANDDGPAGERTEGDDTMSTEEAEADQEEEEESTAETEAESSGGTAEEPVADVEDSAAAEGEPTGDAADAEAASGDDDGSGADAGGGADLWDARETAERVANELIDDPFDGIIEITRDDDGDGWTGVVEVIERRAIPDTQDILGRYEVSIGGDGELEGYRLTGRYRRGDVSDEQAPDR